MEGWHLGTGMKFVAFVLGSGVVFGVLTVRRILFWHKHPRVKLSGP
jgi:hypothetical protein